jgi:hypothetical protein
LADCGAPLLFHRAWARANGFSEADLAKGGAGTIFGVAFVLALVMAFNLAAFLGGPDTTVAWGAAAGALTGLGWVAPAIATVALFERRSFAYLDQWRPLRRGLHRHGPDHRRVEIDLVQRSPNGRIEGGDAPATAPSAAAALGPRSKAKRPRIPGVFEGGATQQRGMQRRPNAEPFRDCRTSMPAFPTTRHSVIERLRTQDGTPRRDAFGDLADGYWKPIYKYLRVKWRLAPEAAEDATQAFFVEAFEKSWLERYEPAKARFRTFVRVCVDRLVMNMQQAEGRAKRGGDARTISVDGFDFGAAEHELLGQTMSAAPEAEEMFKREFVRALFDRAVRAVRQDCVTRGRELHWQLFERYDLSPSAEVSYAALAAEFELTPGQVTGYLAQMRAAFRTHAVAALETLCLDRDEFRREARELLGLEIE